MYIAQIGCVWLDVSIAFALYAQNNIPIHSHEHPFIRIRMDKSVRFLSLSFFASVVYFFIPFYSVVRRLEQTNRTYCSYRFFCFIWELRSIFDTPFWLKSLLARKGSPYADDIFYLQRGEFASVHRLFRIDCSGRLVKMQLIFSNILKQIYPQWKIDFHFDNEIFFKKKNKNNLFIFNQTII